MRVLLVDPEGEKISPGLNLGIAYLSSSLRREGHNVGCVDLHNFSTENPSARLKKAIESFHPDMVGFSIINIAYRRATKLIAECREYYKGYIVAGGPEVSFQKENTLLTIDALDAVVIGEGEESLVKLAECVQAGTKPNSVEGVIFRDRDSNKVITNPARLLRNDIDSYPFPDYEVFGVRRMDIYPVISSRGCPHNCSFCSKYTVRSWRGRQINQVIYEIKQAKEKYQIKILQLWDSCFNPTEKRAEELCDALIASGLNIPWVAMGVRADKISDVVAKKLLLSNCKILWMGIESFDGQVFEAIDKGEKLEDIKRGVQVARKYGLSVYGFMIMGLPHDSLKKTLHSADEAIKLGVDRIFYATATPFTETRLYGWVKEHGTMLGDPLAVNQIITEENNGIIFETKEFSLSDRKKALRALNVKTGFISSKGMHHCIFPLYKIVLILRYDFKNIFRRFLKSIRYRRNKVSRIETLMENAVLCLNRIPDGSWGILKDECSNEDQIIIVRQKDFSIQPERK